MSNANQLPLSLYKANLELQTRLGKLLQESSRQWIDYGYRLANGGIAESNAEIEELLRTQDWQKLATLPAESFWRQLQQRFGDSQALAQIAAAAQAEFAHGVQEAVQAWQKETAAAFGESPSAGFDWTGSFPPWELLLPEAFVAVSVPAAGKTAAAKPAARKATAKKTPARKAAARRKKSG
ncbi:MAG: phasin family protein [Pseudoxanthomonas sp.]